MEANFFAKYLIAPPILVNLIQPNDYMDIAKIFCVSKECAMYSFMYYQKWKNHHFNVGGKFADYEIRILNNCANSVIQRKNAFQIGKQNNNNFYGGF